MVVQGQSRIKDRLGNGEVEKRRRKERCRNEEEGRL